MLSVSAYIFYIMTFLSNPYTPGIPERHMQVMRFESRAACYQYMAVVHDQQRMFNIPYPQTMDCIYVEESEETKRKIHAKQR